VTTRRAFIGTLAGGLLAAPLAAEAQQTGKVFRVGFLTAYSSSADSPLFDWFRQGMRGLGYEEGRNIAYETRWAEGRFERLPSLAAELVGLKLDVMLVSTTPAALAAKKATKTIPIVMTSVGDPVGTGLVDSLARPGENITGNTTIIGEMSGKRLELLKQVVARLSRVAVLGHPGDPIFAVQMRHAEAVARSLKVEVFPVEIRAISELDRAFETIVKRRADGVLRLGDALVVPGRQRTSELAMKHRLPTMATRVEEVEAGLLMSYGPNRAEQFHQAATYVDKILKGAKPADLPVEQPTKFELAINLKTAKALGIKIPNSILLRADKVIE
jgi:putative tryptophan/tyrosine transport system substrate-binding protein